MRSDKNLDMVRIWGKQDFLMGIRKEDKLFA